MTVVTPEQLEGVRAQIAALPPEKQREALPFLVQLEEGLRTNPLWSWRPYPKQADYLAVKRVPLQTKLLAGGNRAGKTEVGVVDDIIQCVDRACLPDELAAFKHWEPPIRVRVISPSFKQLSTVALDKFRKLTPQGQLKGGEWRKAFSKSEQMLRFENGSWIQFLTGEQDVDVHAGVDLDRVHFDEEPTPPEKGRLLWKENEARLIDRGGQMVFTMTPLLGLTFTHDEIYDHRHDDESIEVRRISMEDNPHISPQARAKYLAGLTDDELKARRDGLFVHFGGRVFDELDDHVHFVDPPSKQHVRGLETVVCIDPGLKRTGVLWLGFDTEGVALAYEELYLSDYTVDRVAERIHERNAFWGVDPLFNVIDPAARNRSLTDAEHVEGEYMRHGIPTVHGQNDVEAGIMMWKRRLQAKAPDGTPRPAFLISRDLKYLPWEMGRYRIDQRADGRFAVVKANDHLVDPGRYGLMAMPWEGDVIAPDVRRRHGWTPSFKPGTVPPVSEILRPVDSSGPLGVFT